MTAAPMTREDLVTLLRAWGWSLTGTANNGALEAWTKGRRSVYVPKLKDAIDFDECMDQAEWALATAEAHRLLDVVREVAALAEEWRYKGEFGWGAWQEGEGPDPEGWALDNAAAQIRDALAPLTKEETDGR